MGLIRRARVYKDNTAFPGLSTRCFDSPTRSAVENFPFPTSSSVFAAKMKFFIVFSLLSLGVSGANIEARQQRGGGWGGGWRSRRPTGGGTVVIFPLPTTTARTTARMTSTTARITSTGRPRTTTVYVTATRSSSTARGTPVVTTTVVTLPTQVPDTPYQPGGGGNQSPSCGDSPIACIG